MYTSLRSGFGFKGWTYAIAAVTLALEHLPQSFDPNSMACLNTSCGIILVDRNWLLKRLSGQKINTMSISLKVRGIGTFKHEFSEFAALFLYFSSRNNVGNLVYALLQYKIHLVEDLQANLLINNNIMSSEAMVINLGKKSTLIGAYGIIIDVNAKQQGQFLIKRLLTS